MTDARPGMTGEPTTDAFVVAAPPEATDAPASAAWETPDPAIIGVWRTTGLLWGAGLSSPLVAFGWFVMTDPPGWWYPVAFAPLALAALVAWRMPRRRHAAWRYRREAALLAVHHGVMFRRETVMPYSRIQHVDVTQGPLARRAGLATLVVHTASADGHALGIPGLRFDDATALRDWLATQAGLFDPL